MNTARTVSQTTATKHRFAKVDGLNVFYREAGDPGMPTLLLLHGFPTSSQMYRNLISRLADRYLARTGYDAQQTDEPVTPDRVDNLWAPVPGDHGAHGDFDERARAHSWQLWATTHRGWLFLAGAGLVGALWRVGSGRRNSRPPKPRYIADRAA